MQAVIIRGAYKNYSNKVELNNVLNNLNMNVKCGTIYALMGSSGCGKSTLLSCIVGSLTLDGGSVEVLGSFGSEIPMRKIGYMPQEYALVNEFTIRDVTYFFGRLYGMSERRIKERFKVLRTLLELPEESKLVGECSGGEKRRISFAVSMLHEPELIILDEPTVGLDSLLREKIWNYLKEQTIKSQITVIITTHYIHEASKANHVGLMRNGILIGEEAPQTLLNQLEVDSLQDAFIKLSLKQNLSGYFNTYRKQSIEYFLYKSNKIEHKSSSTLIMNRLKALVIKNILQMFRFTNCFGFMCNLTLPMLCFGLFHYSVGRDPIGLKIGIVNDEINYTDCFDESLITTIALQNKTCELNKISCRFINQFNDSIAEKIFYSNYEEALYDADKGSLMGVIYFTANFTESFTERTCMKINKLNENYNNSDIQIYLDNSDLQWSLFLKRKIIETYKEFAEMLFSDCGLPKKLGNVPVAFQQPIYGDYNQMIQVSMEPVYLLTLMFLLAAMSSSLGILVDRTAGIWNRSLVIGTSIGELLTSQVLSQSLINISQLIIVIIFRSCISESSYQYNSLAFLIIMLIQYSGMVYGFTISVITDNFKSANYTMIGLAFPSLILSGVLWPIQGMPKFLKLFSQTMQFNLPAVALTNIVTKDQTLVDSAVLEGFGILIMWILAPIFISFKLLKHKKFSHIS